MSPLFPLAMVSLFALATVVAGAEAARGPAREITVIAHRGAHERAPENTMPAFENAIALKCDLVEVDIRRTADGGFVCVHNNGVDGHSDGAGLVRDLTLAEIRVLDAGSWFHPSFAGTRIPTADEALRYLRGKAGAYLDVKDAAPDSVVAILKRNRMVATTLIYDDPASLAAMKKIEPRVRPMPEYPGNPASVRALADSLHPDVIAISGFRNLSREAVDACHAVGAKVWVDVMAIDNPEGWARALDAGADGLQTDRPSALVPWLRERGLHR